VSGYPAVNAQRALVRRLGGRCIQIGGGILARNGEAHADCSTCDTPCEGVNLGFSDGVEVGKAWGSDAIELRWLCPGCGCSVTERTTALRSMADAAEIKANGLCYRCRA